MTPDYNIHVSPRAKHVKLKLSVVDGRLTVVIPRRFDRSLISGIVEERRPWIERTQRRLAAHRTHAGTADSNGRPDTITLRALGQVWRVEYRTGQQPARAPAEGEYLLTVRGAVDDHACCLLAVRRWLRRTARAHLLPWLQRLAQERNLHPGRISFRSQQSRWGSCSAHNAISLNQKLLFLPPPLVEQVLLHELCHTIQHDHSPKFWSLLESMSPGGRTRERELRTAWQYVPGWVDGEE